MALWWTQKREFFSVIFPYFFIHFHVILLIEVFESEGISRSEKCHFRNKKSEQKAPIYYEKVIVMTLFDPETSDSHLLKSDSCELGGK